jgi:hypothetical protein
MSIAVYIMHICDMLITVKKAFLRLFLMEGIMFKLNKKLLSLVLALCMVGGFVPVKLSSLKESMSILCGALGGCMIAYGINKLDRFDNMKIPEKKQRPWVLPGLLVGGMGLVNIINSSSRDDFYFLTWILSVSIGLEFALIKLGNSIYYNLHDENLNKFEGMFNNTPENNKNFIKNRETRLLNDISLAMFDDNQAGALQQDFQNKQPVNMQQYCYSYDIHYDIGNFLYFSAMSLLACKGMLLGFVLSHDFSKI